MTPYSILNETEPTLPPRVLVGDDRGEVLLALELLLKPEGYDVDGVTSPDALLRALSAGSYEVVLIDLNYTRDTTSGQEGLELLSRIRELDRDVPVMVMTAWASIELAVDVMRNGSDDFIQKPWDNARLLERLRNRLAAGRARRRRQRDTTGERHTAVELASAHQIQRRLLPGALPKLPGLQVAAFWEPAGDVGGDFYDAAALGPSGSWLCIGDVAGKNVSAALLMANVLAHVRAAVYSDMSPSRLCTEVNRELSARMAAGRFVTMFYCTYDASRRLLSYTNAGHVPPVLVRRDGSTCRLHQGGPVLGVFAQCAYEHAEIRLDRQDRVVLFTDGINEARDGNGIELGEERLVQLAAAGRELEARALEGTLVSTARAFGGGSFEDDATLIVMAVD